MKRELADALAAGAMGFTTSRTRNHETADRRPVASRVAEWGEVRELVRVMGDLGARHLRDRRRGHGPRPRPPARLPRPAARSGGGDRRAGHVGHVQLALRAGRLARVLRPCSTRPRAPAGACSPRCTAARSRCVLSFETRLPFDRLPEWRELRRRPLDEQRAAPARRRRAPAAGEGGRRGGVRPRRRRRGPEARLRVDRCSWRIRADRTGRSPRSRASAAWIRWRP